MGDGADDAIRQAELEFEEWQVHEAGGCQGPSNDDGCSFCNNPEEADEIRALVEEHGAPF